ncbi:MAG: FAD-dependent oxidoreductase, partial [Mycobacteriaceae bacterium]|nr:FAD-dependent oxidoreductase [Mycobacteriaceae bacterium]
ATLLAEPLRRRSISERDLAAVQRRRMPPAVLTQGLQRIIHRRLMAPILQGRIKEPPAVLLDLVRRLPWLASVPAYVIGVGVRPEHAPGFARRLNR